MTRFTATPYDALEIGAQAEMSRLCVADDLFLFAHVSGNLNPMHLPAHDGDGDGVNEAVAPSMWVGALISAVLGNILPGPGTLYRRQTLDFVGRAHAGERLTAKVRVLQKRHERVVVLETWVEGEGGERIAQGEAEVIAPERALSFDIDDMPDLTLARHVHFDQLLERAEKLDPIPTAIVAPEAAHALGGALLAAEHTLIQPILIGDRAKIERAAAELGVSVDGEEIIDAPSHDRAAAAGVELVRAGRAKALMKGHLHTDELLKHVVKREGGLRGRRRLSHVFVMDVPGVPHLLLVTDAAINIAPDLDAKIDITQNAIDLARALGIEQPKVGVLSAVETVNPKIPSTLDAAVLSKMAERGQITGGLVDGPLAMDNAMDVEAAKTKGIKSLVAGRAEIFIAPNLEAGNMLAKELIYAAHAEGGGVVMGARCPIVLTSRSDDDKARLASCAVAALYADWAAKTGAHA